MIIRMVAIHSQIGGTSVELTHNIGIAESSDSTPIPQRVGRVCELAFSASYVFLSDCIIMFQFQWSDSIMLWFRSDVIVRSLFLYFISVVVCALAV